MRERNISMTNIHGKRTKHFLDASSHLFVWVCPTVCPWVCGYIRFLFQKKMHRTYLIAFFGLFLPNSSTIMAVILYCTTIVSSFNQMNPISCSYPDQMNCTILLINMRTPVSSHNLLISYRIFKKSVTNLNVFELSTNLDQSHLCSLNRSKMAPI